MTPILDSAERWHVHALAVPYGVAAGIVVLVGALAVAALLMWRARRRERDLLRKYPSRAGR